MAAGIVRHRTVVALSFCNFTTLTAKHTELASQLTTRMPAQALSAPAAGVCVPSPLVPGGCLVSIGSGVQMAYSLVPPNSIAIALTAQTQGYISVSFTPGSYHMSPADAVFGWIENGQATVAAYQVNGYSTSDITPDGSVPLTNTSVTQSGGFTTITFTRPLVAGRYHIDPAAMSYDVAVGSSPGLVKHTSASSGIADLSTGLVTITSIDPRDKYWITHGILMIFAWALLVPHAIGFAMFKVKWSAIFQRDAMWFHVHRGVQFVALVSHVISMIIALTKFGNFIQDGTMNAHSALAWIVTALLGIQWLVALFLRPNKTAARRPLWNLAHFNTARIMIAAALANISIGIYLYNRKTNRLLMPLGAWIGVFLVCLASAAVHFGWLALRAAPPLKEEGANVELPAGQPQAKFEDQADNLSTP